ncbi:hypothetical protein NKJ87_17845 [Mesorhizobium sp. M0027]|uniref:hypothetical protein n=1 Tax=Mesorhizobium sp. M0027 TaxID=2956848 RepID=UPI00333D4FB8
MPIKNTTAATRAATPDLYRRFDGPNALAKSLERTVSYLEHCAEKHNVIGEAARSYALAKQRCERIANDLRSLKGSNPALVRYRNAFYNLDAVQIEAFSRIIIDYQARIGDGFVPVSTNHYLADLTAIAFTLEAIQDPACLIGVGAGFGPRFRMREAA